MPPEPELVFEAHEYVFSTMTQFSTVPVLQKRRGAKATVVDGAA